MKKYTAIYQRYRSSEILTSHFTSEFKDLWIKAQHPNREMSLILLFEGYLTDISYQLNESFKKHPIKKQRKYKSHSVFNLYASFFSTKKRFNTMNDIDVKIENLINKIEEGNLDSIYWYDLDSKICFLSPEKNTSRHVFVFDNMLLKSDFLQGTTETLPCDSFTIKLALKSFYTDKLSDIDSHKLKTVFNLNP